MIDEVEKGVLLQSSSVVALNQKCLICLGLGESVVCGEWNDRRKSEGGGNNNARALSSRRAECCRLLLNLLLHYYYSRAPLLVGYLLCCRIRVAPSFSRHVGRSDDEDASTP